MEIKDSYNYYFLIFSDKNIENIRLRLCPCYINSGMYTYICFFSYTENFILKLNHNKEIKEIYWQMCIKPPLKSNQKNMFVCVYMCVCIYLEFAQLNSWVLFFVLSNKLLTCSTFLFIVCVCEDLICWHPTPHDPPKPQRSVLGSFLSF